MYVENEQRGYLLTREHQFIQKDVRAFACKNRIKRLYNEVTGKWSFLCEGQYLEVGGKHYESLGMFCVPTIYEMYYHDFSGKFLDPKARHVYRIPDGARDVFGKVVNA